MKNRLILILSIFMLYTMSSCLAQQADGLNLDFEQAENGMPVQWTSFGSDKYVIGLDRTKPNRGKYSAVIESRPDGKADFKALSLEIPGNYEGSHITLTGYIRTENVTDGYAGLWMRIDPNVGFYNMHDRGVTGTTDWSRYEITLPLNPHETEKIVVGGLLVGSGKMWIDDLSITIDGRDIRDLTPVEIIPFPAKQDKEFDGGSGINDIKPSAANLNTLYDLGLIWGFLKYYHPTIAKGDRNWDYELFRILPRIINIDDMAKRDGIIAQWILELGEIVPRTDTTITGKVKMEPDLAWIGNSGFSEELTLALNDVRNASRTKSHYYISLINGVGNPEFKNEEPYTHMKYPDMGFRILSLYRYWNMIQYFFPYKNLIEEDWKDVLKEFIPRFISIGDETKYALTTLEITARINDSHAAFWTESNALTNYWGKSYADPFINFVEDKAVVVGFHNKDRGKATGLKIGDVITHIDGIPVNDIIKAQLPLTPASNYPMKLRKIGINLLRTKSGAIDVTYERDGQSRDATLKAYPNINPYKKINVPKSSFRMLNNDIGCLYPALLKTNDIDRLWEYIKKTKGLVIDLRCYPSDFIVFSLGWRLVPQSTPFVALSSGSIQTPGLFTMRDGPAIGRDNPDYYKGKVVILLNETTQSSAEYTAMALRTAPNATVIGSTTSGADGNVSRITLPGGLHTSISGIGIYYPDGTETQRVGIVPNLELRPTIRGIQQGKDELMEKTLEIIKSHVNEAGN